MKITVNGNALITDDAGKPLANYQINATVHSLEGLIAEILKVAEKNEASVTSLVDQVTKGMMQ